MQFCAKLRKIIEEAIKRCHKIQFFLWCSIKFFLNVHNFRVREVCKIRSLGYVFPYQFIGIFNAFFLPVGMRCISSILELRSTNVNITCCWLSNVSSI